VTWPVPRNFTGHVTGHFFVRPGRTWYNYCIAFVARGTLSSCTEVIMSVQPLTTDQPQQAIQPARQSTCAQPSDLDSLKVSLRNRIFSQLGFTQHDFSERGTVQEVVKAYTGSLEKLRADREEAAHFVEALGKVHLQTIEEGAKRVDRLQQAAAEELNELQDLVQLPPVLVSANLEAELFSMHAFEAYSLLRDDLRRSVEEFVQNLFAVFDRLVERQVVGEISFPNENACRFRYFETHLRERDVRSSRRIDDDDDNSQVTTISGSIDVEVHGQQQHLAATSRHPLPKYPRLIPQRFRNLLEECPAWLRPEIEVVEGDRFRSDKGKHLVKTKQWLERRITHLPRKTHFPSTFVDYHEDPAITLGPFVLGAWECEEREAELHEIQQTKLEHWQTLANQRLAAQTRAYRNLAVVVCLQIVPLLLHLAGSALWSPLHAVALTLSLVLLGPVWQALREHAWAHDASPDGPFMVLGMAGGLFASLAWQCGFLALIYGALLPAVGLVVFAVAAFIFARESLAAVRAC
jgi:hypothetical protein